VDISILPTAKYTVTVLNKLRSVDSPTKKDVWSKETISGCTWSEKTVRAVAGTTVQTASTRIVRAPQNSLYLPYQEWIAKTETNFTFSTGDYLILGEIPETDITPQNVLQIVQKYRPNAFEIKAFKDNTALGLAGHYRIEGS
jgi:hypothetical protein